MLVHPKVTPLDGMLVHRKVTPLSPLDGMLVHRKVTPPLPPGWDASPSQGYPPGWDASPSQGYPPLSSLDGMLVHPKVTPPSIMPPVPIYTPGWRETTWSKVFLSKETTRRQRPGLEPPTFRLKVQRAKR